MRTTCRRFPVPRALFPAVQRVMLGMLMAMVLAACGPAGPSAPGRANPRVLTGEEIRESPASSVFEAVQRLRPSWLSVRTHAGDRGYPAVFVGSQRYGDVEALRTLQTDNVREVRYFDSVDAATRFGRNVPFGVIQVTLDIGG